MNDVSIDPTHAAGVPPEQRTARKLFDKAPGHIAAVMRNGATAQGARLVNGAQISLKGADRPETMRGVSLKFVVLDEYGDMRPNVFEQILRPALADLKGKALFIGTPMGRNHFYDLYQYGLEDKDEDYKSWHFTSFDNPLLDPKEIETAKKSMSSFAFRTEFLASFEAPRLIAPSILFKLLYPNSDAV